MSKLVRIKWLQLHQPLNLPGPGTANKWHVSNAPGIYKGQVRSIVRDAHGYWMHLPHGQNAGFYHIPYEAIAAAYSTEPPQEVLDEIAAQQAEDKAKEAAAEKAIADAKAEAEKPKRKSNKAA